MVKRGQSLPEKRPEGENDLLEAWREEWLLALQRPKPSDGERAGHGSIKA